ncbi:HEAT repeat domain-containing protein [Acaryochloris sp. CCMEE 5410]|uniref:HEAT repeat domain-containing protein n=1 Tax=Acaryochloris sp. CCMEE 5410 TaxID=310037 RepID=UPI00024842CD|nr:HEAT repeat domain-containing protein [Acaryochloris sp. CCMEE 5410]KAI9134086.1 HEAT repeat domain-containing protein [Acaryochloris sp. CCMEE 5410]
MYNEEDLSLLDDEDNLESPLDHMAAVDDPAAEAAKPDVEEMLQFLASTDVTQRMIAARAFCELQDPRAIPYLIQLLSDACPLVRVSAAYALGRNPSNTAVLPLIHQFHQDWNGYVRKGVVWALGNCRDQRVLEPLVDALENDISAVRLWAASSLGQLSEIDADVAAAAIPAVLHALQTESMAPVRSNCAWSLGQLSKVLARGDLYGQAIAAMIKALSDEDLGVQEDAKSSLLKLGDPTGLQAIEELESMGLL